MMARQFSLWRLGLILFFISYAPGQAYSPLDRERSMAGARLYFAPDHDLAEIDVGLIGQARRQVDMAAFVLTERSVMESLVRASERGVRIRLYLDPNQPAARNRDSRFWRLLDTPGVEVRAKGAGQAFMHLKSYQIDGRLLRTGGANFSLSGSRNQDNDLIVLESRALAEQFMRKFEELWRRPDNRPFTPPSARR